MSNAEQAPVTPLEYVDLTVGFKDPITGIVYTSVVVSEMTGESDRLLTAERDKSIYHRMLLVAARNLVSAHGKTGELVDFKNDKTPSASDFVAGLVRQDLMLVLARIGMLTYGDAGRMKVSCGSKLADGRACGHKNNIKTDPRALGAPVTREPEEDDEGDYHQLAKSLIVPGSTSVTFQVYRNKSTRRYHATDANAAIDAEVDGHMLVTAALDTAEIVQLSDNLPEDADPWSAVQVRLQQISGSGVTRSFIKPRMLSVKAKGKPDATVTKLDADDEAFCRDLPSGARRVIGAVLAEVRVANWDWIVSYTCASCKAQQEFFYDPVIAFLGLPAM